MGNEKEKQIWSIVLNIEGHGPYEIAKILYEDQIETPCVYMGKRGIGFWKNKEEFPNPYNWTGYRQDRHSIPAARQNRPDPGTSQRHMV